nr:hypothetical protein [Tanacetum cinerariifolium]
MHLPEAFEEAELPKLKAEKPGLTHTQYKDMIWKIWKKSPDNPLNQNYWLIAKTGIGEPVEGQTLMDAENVEFEAA